MARVAGRRPGKSSTTGPEESRRVCRTRRRAFDSTRKLIRSKRVSELSLQAGCGPVSKAVRRTPAGSQQITLYLEERSTTMSAHAGRTSSPGQQVTPVIIKTGGDLPGGNLDANVSPV